MPSPKLVETDLNGRFKSILKKPSTFGDSDSSPNLDRSPPPLKKIGSQKGSQFYLPTPLTTPRKKVQFLMEKEYKDDEMVNGNYENVAFDEEETYEDIFPNQTSKIDNQAPVKLKSAKVEKPSKIPRPKETVNEADNRYTKTGKNKSFFLYKLLYLKLILINISVSR